MATQSVITRLPAERVTEAVGVLSRAFAEDPVLTFYLNEPSRRTRAYRAFFGNVIRAHLRFGHVYAGMIDDYVAGAAVWRPPEAGAPTLRDRLRTFTAELTVRALFPRTADGLFRGFDATKVLHPNEPHWYLLFVGIDTDLQGKGIGAGLLGPVLELADGTGTLCYLETPFPRTHAFYRRLGFQIASESHPFVGAPSLWTMIRRPQKVPRL